MKYLFSSARLLLGTIFLFFGLNGFFLFIPVPDFHPFMEILVESSYINVVKTFEVIGGILLLINRYKGVALLILGPIVFNILLYHLLLDPRNWPISVINALCYGLIAWHCRELFFPFFQKTVGLYQD